MHLNARWHAEKLVLYFSIKVFSAALHLVLVVDFRTVSHW